MMMSKIPLSLGFFAITAVVFVLQWFPFTGIFLMFVAAMAWSVLLVNAGMMGIAAEAVVGRVSRWWLTVPIAFYCGYWIVAAFDHATLRALSVEYDAANAAVEIPFDPKKHSLAFDSGGSGAWLTQNYDLPVVYSTNVDFPEEYRSYRIMDADTCTKVRETPALRAAFVDTLWFHNGGSTGQRQLEKRFCNLSMPERPELPVVLVSRQEEEGFEGSLPVRRVTTTVTLPGGEQFQLFGGVASPLSWMPRPILGCALNSGAPSWDCVAQFWRSRFTPIVSGDGRFRRDTKVLAVALGLRPVLAAERKGSDPAPMLVKMAAVENTTLMRQLSNIDAMIDNPIAKVRDWQVGVVTSRPEVLVARAEAIMTGVERAVAFKAKEHFYKARESGFILVLLLTHLPSEKFVELSPRILALYSKADNQHWLWGIPSLACRIVDLEIDGVPDLPRFKRVCSS